MAIAVDLSDRAHRATVPRSSRPRGVPDPGHVPGDSPAGSPGPGWLEVLLFDGDAPATWGITYAWGCVSVGEYAVVRVSGVIFRVVLATGAVQRHRVDRWVPTRWRVVPWWAWIPALADLGRQGGR